jgi:hypothetical protein
MGKIPTREELITSLTNEELAKVKNRVLASLTPDDMQIVKERLLASITPEEITTRFSQTVFDHHTPAQLIAMVDPEDILDCLPFSKVFGFVAEHFMESIGQFSGQFSHFFTAHQEMPKPVRPAPHKPAEPIQRTTPITAPAPTPAIPKVARVEKPKVTILGLKGDQQQNVLRQLGNRCNFTFIEADRTGKSIPDGQDVIVLWAKFSNHAIQSQAKSKVGQGTRLITHHGGLSEMIKKLEQVLNGEVVQPTRPGSGVGVN